MTDKLNIDIRSDAFVIEFNENRHFNLSTESKLEIEVNKQESDELHTKFLKLLDAMQLKIAMTKAESEYQKRLITALENIVKQRMRLSSQSKLIKLQSIKKYLEVIEYELELDKPKQDKKQDKKHIKQAQKPIKKPSKRWYKKT